MEPKSHIFDIELAIQHGVNAAIVIQHFAFWIQKNKANENKKRHFYEGRWWTFNSMEALTVIFPYWNRRQIRHILDTLVKEKIILKRAAAAGGDRSNWYAFSDDEPLDKNVQWHWTKKATPLDKNVQCVDKNVQCHIRKTDNYTNNYTDRRKTSSPKLSASRDDEQQAYQLLRKEGVGKSSAQILASQHTVDEIVQAVTGAVMKARDISTGDKSVPFKRAGYIVATLNQSRAEGHPVRLSHKTRKAIDKIGRARRVETSLSNAEIKQAKQTIMAALYAAR